MTSAPQWLEIWAEAGELGAQAALVIVYAYGLQGAPADPAKSAHWREVVDTRQTPDLFTAYTPGFGGQPGRVNVMRVSKTPGRPLDLARLERCADALERGDLGSAACGTPADFERRQGQWRQARRP